MAHGATPHCVSLAMLLDQVIHEIKELKDRPGHRSALIIFQLLDNNRKRFLEKMDPENFNAVCNAFERLSEASAREYNSPNYTGDYQRAYNLLTFYTDRII